MRNLQLFNLLPILALASFVIKINGSVSPRPLLTGPDMAFLGSKVVFKCISPWSSPPIYYQLMRDSDQLVATYTDFQGNQPAVFSFKTTLTSEGSYYCKAKKGGKAKVSNSTQLLVATPVSGTSVTTERFPPVAYEGSHLILSCDVSQGSHLSYTWFFQRRVVTSSTLPLFHQTGNKLVLKKVTLKHAGNYSCLAGSRLKDTSRFSSSGEIQVTVKVNVSTPRISFTISKKGSDYSGNVTCRCSKGSLPVNFSLSLDDKVVSSTTATKSLVAWFPVAVVPGLDMGVVRCLVKNEVQDLMSEPLTLEVVPVGGHAKVDVEYLYRADSKMATARLHCQISMGTFPFFTWVFNDTVLPSDTDVDIHIKPNLHHYVFTDHRRVLILSQIGPVESGYYRCRARDSYDDSTRWVESAAVLVQVKGSLTPCLEYLPTPSTETPPKVMTSIEVVVIAFCCFLLVALSLAVACVYRMFDHKQGHTYIGTVNTSSGVPALSSPTSQSVGKQVNRSSIATAVLNQAIESTYLHMWDHSSLYVHEVWILSIFGCTKMSARLFVVIVGLCYCSQESILGPPILQGPTVAVVNDAVEFYCEVQKYPKNESLSVEIFQDGFTKVFAEAPAIKGSVYGRNIKKYHEGYLECRVSLMNNSLIKPTVSMKHYLKVIEPVKNAKIVVQSGPEDFFEGAELQLDCKVSAGNHLSFRWLLNGEPVSKSLVRDHQHNKLVIDRTTSQDSGSYMCVAANQFNKTRVFTSNSSVEIRVKVVVSNPDISFTVMKEDAQNYSAIVMCQSTRGTPYITFSLYNETEFVANETVETQRARFKLPMVLGRHLGRLQCQAYNGNRTVKSEWMDLEYVQVGEPVELKYKYDIGSDFAVTGLTVYCTVAKGTQPQFRWFLNKTSLEGKGSFYWVHHLPPVMSKLILSVGRSSAGTYHCEAWDSFDSTTVIRSRKRYMDKQVLNRLPIAVVAAVFGCFAILISTVSVCCCVGVVFREFSPFPALIAPSFVNLVKQPCLLSFQGEGSVERSLCESFRYWKRTHENVTATETPDTPQISNKEAFSFSCVSVIYNRHLLSRWIQETDTEMKGMLPTYEDELDVTEYSEDADVIKAARVEGSDQVSETSVDEWPLIKEQKRNLEEEELAEEP
ncbi:LOW QUALITY PROTEIN: uncharacterized protein LOC142994829 [Genypterus blacodes]|uniref:LOW QUALITY PROTEIN: uncharacterized protein LOC142994829 n=1 Tax=Genypterus blacodes TaxID=154954 RepID=UPI003F76B917